MAELHERESEILARILHTAMAANDLTAFWYLVPMVRWRPEAEQFDRLLKIGAAVRDPAQCERLIYETVRWGGGAKDRLATEAGQRFLAALEAADHPGLQRAAALLRKECARTQTPGA